MPDGFGGGLELADGGGGRPSPHAQVFHPDKPGIAPRHGRVVLTDGTNKWFDAEKCKYRYVCVDETSPLFGCGVYLTPKGNWVSWSPGGVFAGPAVQATTAAYVVGFIKANGYDVPAELKATETAQEY